MGRTNGRPDHMNEIEEVSDDQSSDDEYYPVSLVLPISS